MKFKVGNIVRVKEPTISKSLVGFEGEITNIDESDRELPYEVEFDSVGYEEWFGDEELELVEGENNGND